MFWVKTWLRRSNGLIGVESEPGGGTTVTIRFQTDLLPGGHVDSTGGSR
jgi:hypothetical protein